jgi:uncharacterized membrane protein
MRPIETHPAPADGAPSPAPAPAPETVTHRIAETSGLSQVADALERAADVVVPEGPVRDAARGTWLGHAVHPMLTDLPIGFWTSAFVVDLLPTRKARTVADVLVGLGLATAVPTALAGLAELTGLRDEPTRRVTAAHAIGNATGTVLYGWSLVARRRGHRLRGVTVSWAAAGALTVGGFLGGHLTYRRAAGVSPAP